MNVYLKIIFFIISLMLLSCNFNANKNSKIQKNNDKVVKENKYEAEKMSFVDELRKNRECMKDSQRADILVSGDFFESKSSKKNEYILYFNYLLEHSYEEFDETITQYTYSMFIKYPSKFLELDYYRLFLNGSQKEVVLYKITNQLSSELIFKDSISNVSETEFGKMFTFLKDHGCIKYFTRMKNESQR